MICDRGFLAVFAIGVVFMSACSNSDAAPVIPAAPTPGSELNRVTADSTVTSAATTAPAINTVSPATTTTAITTTVTTTAPTTTTTTTTTVPVVLGDELVINSGFEVGEVSPDGWRLDEVGAGATLEWIREDDRYISMSGLVSSDHWPQIVSDEYAVAPGEELMVSIDARTDSEGLLFLTMAFLDGNGVEFVGFGPGTRSVDTSDWATLESRLAAPDGAASAYLVLNLALNGELTDATNLDINIDNVSVRVVESG
jgi:hypothetical protein